jgi:uncharacterized protein YigA (DUF484 family)
MGEGKGRSDRLPPATTSIGSAEVAAYFRAHPDCLSEHQDLVLLLTPPAWRRGENIVDLQQFMLHRLREEVARLKTQQRSLISTSRSNMTSTQRIHAAVLAVVAAHGLEHLLQTVTIDLAVLLDVDLVTLCLEHRAGFAAPAGVQLLPAGEIGHLLGPGRGALLEDRVRADPAIFGDGADLVKSEALLRLSIPGAPPGLLALGSRRPSKFKAGHGTELLAFLAQTLAIKIGPWLVPPLVI